MGPARLGGLGPLPLTVPHKIARQGGLGRQPLEKSRASGQSTEPLTDPPEQSDDGPRHCLNGPGDHKISRIPTFSKPANGDDMRTRLTGIPAWALAAAVLHSALP